MAQKGKGSMDLPGTVLGVSGPVLDEESNDPGAQPLNTDAVALGSNNTESSVTYVTVATSIFTPDVATNIVAVYAWAVFGGVGRNEFMKVIEGGGDIISEVTQAGGNSAITRLTASKIFEKIGTTSLVKSTLQFGIKINKLISKRSLMVLKNTAINGIGTQLKLDRKPIRSND